MKYFADPIVKFIVFCSVLLSVLVPVYSYLTIVKIDGTLIVLSVIFIIVMSFMIIFGRIFIGPNFFEGALNFIFNFGKKGYEDISHTDEIITEIKTEFGVVITCKDASILWKIHFEGKKSSRQISQSKY